MSLRHREERLEAAREDAETQLEDRSGAARHRGYNAVRCGHARVPEGLDDPRAQGAHAQLRGGHRGDGRGGGADVHGPMPSDGAMSESAAVLDFVKSGPPEQYTI